jgi:glycosyltransferase involved in cell wall biosynthesis
VRIGCNLGFLRPGKVGGTEVHARNIIPRLLKSSNHEFVLFLPAEVSKSDWLQRLGVPTVSIGSRKPPLGFVMEQRAIPRQTRRLGLDLIHSFGYTIPFGAPSKHIVTIHDLNYANVHMNFLRRQVLGKMIKRSARQADFVCTVSEYSKAQISEHLAIPLSRIVVTPNGPSEAAINPAERSPENGRLLVLSSPSPHKNVDVLMQAAQLLQRRGVNFSLRIVGHLPPKFKVPTQLLESVQTLGYLSQDDLRHEMRKCSIFLMPSLYEGFGIPLLDAMRSGVPAISSGRASLHEIGGGFVREINPFDPAGWAREIEAMMGGRAGNTVQGAREFASKYDWDVAAKEIIGLYDGLAAARRSSYVPR